MRNYIKSEWYRVTHTPTFYVFTGILAGLTLLLNLALWFLDKVDPENNRQIKANDSYYLLKKTSVPIVIAECGFLSNWEEAEKLCSEAYQEKIAWAICVGILQHLNMK